MVQTRRGGLLCLYVYGRQYYVFGLGEVTRNSEPTNNLQL